MPGLFGMLSGTANSLDAQRYGLDVVGQNIANVNTPGYTRRVVDFAAVPPPDQLSAGGGVEVQSTRSLRDRLLDRRLWQETPAQSQQDALLEQLQVVEVALGGAGKSIDGKLGQFFDAFAELADAPTSATARQQVVSAAQSLTSEFHSVASRLSASARDADQRIRGAVEDINTLAKQIANLNKQIGNAPPNAVAHLQDEQRLAVDKLAEIVDIEAIEQPSGGVDIVFGNGHPLAISDVSYTVTAASLGPSGYADIQAGGISVTSELKGGRIGGLLQVRDTEVPSYLDRVDQIAYTVAAQVNTLHATGFDQSGTAGGVFFAPLGAAAGAAAAIGVSTTISSDPSRIAAAGTPVVGDNAVARGLAALRDARVASGGTTTLTDAWGQLLYDVGSDTAAAKSNAGAQGEVVRQLQTVRDSVSGVSIDEEAAMMLRFQRAYEANARFFSAVDASLAVLLNLGQ